MRRAQVTSNDRKKTLRPGSGEATGGRAIVVRVTSFVVYTKSQARLAVIPVTSGTKPTEDTKQHSVTAHISYS